MRRFFAFTLTALLLGSPGLAWAYVGPGSGITLLGALWSVLAGVFIVLSTLILWPLRALLRWRRSRAAHGQE
jgi:hypothetical protein